MDQPIRFCPVFGTTYGHSDETFKDPVFIDLLARGLTWAASKL